MAPASLTTECLICGSSLSFAPGQFTTRCSVCEDDRPLPLRFAGELADSPVDDAEPNLDALAGRSRWRCMGPGCGAVLSAPQPGPSLRRCPCCWSELFEDTRAPAMLEPHGLLPFLLGESEVLARVRVELDRLRLRGSVEQLARAYLPAGVVGCEAEADYEGERGTEYEVNGNRRARWEPCSGSVERPFENVRASLAASPPRALVERLEPWDWGFCEAYAPAKLDAPAVHLLLAPAELFTTAFADPRPALRDEAMFDIGGDYQRVHRIDYRLSARRYRLIMLPVWIGRVEPGAAPFVVNGRTGEVAVHGHASAERNPDDQPLVPVPWHSRPEVWLLIVGAIVGFGMIAASALDLLD